VSRRGNAADRCPVCRMHSSLCVCSLIPRLETRTRVVLFIHRFEDRKSTNTGRLATRCLPNSEVVVRGLESQHNPPFVAEPGARSLLLFPHPDARPLAEFIGADRPITLIVPDGTWRQASKVRQRVPGLSELPCVALPAGERSQYRVRFEPHGEGLATIEAIARAMGILEGPEVQAALERVFRTVVERILWSRGTIPSAAVTDGIPEGAQRHDPRSGASMP
jgi:DTW domain-containing protein YfiP